MPLIVLPDISPRIVTGRKDAVTNGFANGRHCKGGVVAAPFSPSLYGEKVPAGG